MKQKHLLLIVLTGLILFFYGLGSRDFWGTTEARVGEIVREMLEKNDWVIPHLNGQPRLTKPPLYFWSTALLAGLLNDSQVNELIARIPSAFCAVWVLVITYLIAQKIYNSKTGLISVFILATNILFFWWARQAAIDMMMVMFSSASVLFFAYGLYSQGKKKDVCYLLMHANFGLGMLTKGPVAVIVPVLGMITYLILEKRMAELKRMCWGKGLIIFILILLPWGFMVIKRYPAALTIFYNETFNRYTDAFDHNRPFYYYFVSAPLYLLPWALALPFIIRRMIKYKEWNLYNFPVSFFVPAFIFLSISGSKRSYYLLPLFPFVVMAIGYYLSSLKISDFKSAKIRKILELFLIRKYRIISIFIIFVCFIGLISYFKVSNRKYSAVDLCGKISGIVPEEAVFMTYKYSRPYIVYYLKKQVPSIESEEELNLRLTELPCLYVLLQKKDFLRMNSVNAEVILEYPDFTKSNNDMVLITRAKR